MCKSGKEKIEEHGLQAGEIQSESVPSTLSFLK